MSAILPPPSLCIGFTGTRAGMTQEQHVRTQARVHELNVRLFGLFAVHGDCVGADSEFDNICGGLGIPRGVYPSDVPALRAFRHYWPASSAIVLHEPAPPLARNRWIPLACERIIATPGQMEERKRSGTCHCIRAARRLNRVILTIWPDGSERLEGGQW